MEVENTLLLLLQSYEEQLLRPETRRSSHRLSELIADEFLEIGASGKIFRKQDVIDNLNNEESFESIISNFHSTQITKEIVLVTYTLERSVMNGKQGRISIRSSLWKLEQDHWKIIFHQGTIPGTV